MVSIDQTLLSLIANPDGGSTTTMCKAVQRSDQTVRERMLKLIAAGKAVEHRHKVTIMYFPSALAAQAFAARAAAAQIEHNRLARETRCHRLAMRYRKDAGLPEDYVRPQTLRERVEALLAERGKLDRVAVVEALGATDKAASSTLSELARQKRAWTVHLAGHRTVYFSTPEAAAAHKPAANPKRSRVDASRPKYADEAAKRKRAALLADVDVDYSSATVEIVKGYTHDSRYQVGPGEAVPRVIGL